MNVTEKKVSAHAELIDETNVTAAEASRILNVPSSTIRTWKNRGKLHPKGLSRAGEPRYRLGDVRRLITPAA